MFTINLFSNSSDREVADKVISPLGSIQAQYNEQTGILEPSIRVESNGIPQFNYVQIPYFGNRYYFIKGDPINLGHNMWQLDLEEDVRMTWKNEYRQLVAVVGRQENSINPYLVDNLAPIQSDSVFSVKVFPGGDNKVKFGTKNNLLLINYSIVPEF